jgi:hypothetical protein
MSSGSPSIGVTDAKAPGIEGFDRGDAEEHDQVPNEAHAPLHDSPQQPNNAFRAGRDRRHDECATVGPENVPIPISTRKLAGLWNGRSPLPSRESTKSAHTSHVPA